MGSRIAAQRSRRERSTHDLQAYVVDRITSWAGDGLGAHYWLGEVAAPWPSTASEITGSIGPAVLDAIAAVILSDWLDEADYDALFGPWDQAIDAFDEEDEA